MAHSRLSVYGYDKLGLGFVGSQHLKWNYLVEHVFAVVLNGLGGKGQVVTVESLAIDSDDFKLAWVFVDACKANIEVKSIFKVRDHLVVRNHDSVVKIVTAIHYVVANVFGVVMPSDVLRERLNSVLVHALHSVPSTEGSR